MSHFEKLFELLLEKQQEASDQLHQEIFQERSILWNEQILPKIEQLFHRNRENHLKQFLQERSDASSRTDITVSASSDLLIRNKKNDEYTIFRELFSREEEKEYRKKETKYILSKQFDQVFELLKKENQALWAFTSFIPRGDATKLFLKIPTKLDTENQIQQLLENVENDMKNEYARNGQLRDYENAKYLISNFKERNEKERTNISSLQHEIQESAEVMEEDKDDSIFSKDIRMRTVLERFFHHKLRMKGKRVK